MSGKEDWKVRELIKRMELERQALFEAYVSGLKSRDEFVELTVAIGNFIDGVRKEIWGR